MIHIFRESKKSKRVLVLFHGTGGDEHDLIPLCEDIDSDASILSLRGNVSENGMLRFFVRFSNGKFDQESIKNEANQIFTFISDFLLRNKRNASDLVFVGFSNGANMIVALMLLYPKLVRCALVLHGLQPIEPAPSVDLNGASVFVSVGLGDQMIEPSKTMALISLLRAKGANVTVHKDDSGHTINEGESDAVREFLSNNN